MNIYIYVHKHKHTHTQYMRQKLTEGKEDILTTAGDFHSLLNN